MILRPTVTFRTPGTSAHSAIVSFIAGAASHGPGRAHLFQLFHLVGGQNPFQLGPHVRLQGHDLLFLVVRQI